MLEEPLQRFVCSVAEVGQPKVTGTGWFVTPTIGLTCAHVLDNSNAKKGQNIEVGFPFASGAKLEARVEHVDRKRDLAAFRLTGTFTIKRPGPLIEPVARASHLETFGFPEGYDQAYLGVPATITSPGRIAGNGWNLVNKDQAGGFFIKEGFSGAPVWDVIRFGVCGMVVAVDSDPESKTAFLISSAVIEVFLNTLGVDLADANNRINDAADVALYAASTNRTGCHEEVLSHMRHELSKEGDPVARYWLYVCCGSLNTAEAINFLKEAEKSEVFEFAKKGIKRAISNLVV
ncbi:MAG: serine protease [Pseudomonadota bacterium]